MIEATPHEIGRPRRRIATYAAWWAIATAVALLLASRWLDTPSVQYLVAWAVATVASVGFLARVRAKRASNETRTPRTTRVGWTIGCTALIVACWVLAARAQRQLARVTRDLPAWQTEISSGALSVLDAELTAAARSLTRTARAALDAPADRPAAFAFLDALDGGEDEGGVILYRGDSAFAWGGRHRVPTESFRDSIGVSASEFYLTLYAVSARGADRAVATSLLGAAPPADRLANALARRVASEQGLATFAFTAPGRTPGDGSSVGSGSVLHFSYDGRSLLDARALPLESEAVLQRLRERLRIEVGALLALALACFIVAAWRETRTLRWRLAALGVALVSSALVPVNQFSNLTQLFDPAVYFTPLGGSLTASAGALGVTSAIALLALLTILRRKRATPRLAAGIIVLLVAGLGPFLLRDLARGIKPPSYGVSGSLWLVWQIPLFLAAVAVLLAGAGAGSVLLGRSRGLAPWIAPALAGLAAMLAPIVWEAPGQWPWWYTFLWIGAIAALALSRLTRFVVVSAATLAALGAATLVWGRTARGRVELAERDLASLSDPDPQGARMLLERFGASLQSEPQPTTRAALLQQYVTSDLAPGGFPAALYAFGDSVHPLASFQTASFAIPMDEVARVVGEARRVGRPVLTTLAAEPALEQLLVVPAAVADDSAGSTTTAVVVAPKTRLIPNDPFVRLLGVELDPSAEAPYTLQLTATDSLATPSFDRRASWRRRESAVHGDWLVRTGRGVAHAHVEVELRSPFELVERGTLIVLLDLAIVALLWTLSVLADGGFGRWLRVRKRTWARSYRLRLTIALFAFFVIPAVGFAAWSYQQLSESALRSREVLVSETLRAVSPDERDPDWMVRESARLRTPLLLYLAGELRRASDPLYESLAPVGRLLEEDVERLLVLGDEETVSRPMDIGSVRALFGFRSIDRPGQSDLVLSSPARADEEVLGRGRGDLSIFVLFATAVGALGALWLSGIAARQLARPIGSLRRAALAIAGGDRLPALDREPTVEFQPVFAAFRRMAQDLNASRNALEEAQRRTAAILRNVASGVIAVNPSGAVVLANPRADVLLDAPLPPGTVLANVAPAPLTDAVRRFIAEGAEDEAFELEVAGQRQFRVRLARLTRGGAVVTLDDVTELARAQRVLAWGEMARQVAHEIKNPLTPIRLGVQHLRRARADQRVDFDRVLDQNVNRILSEIDRLDEIARAFSRYGSAPNDRSPAIPIDVAAVVRDVVGLESMAGDGAHDAVQWRVEGADAPVTALARDEELREVLLNVLENARLAHARDVAVSVRQHHDDGARDVVIEVRDDGQGIPDDVLPRIFEPHFSTRTSGSGLGLAISRQIIDGWGGEIAVSSRMGKGTTVRIVLRAARRDGE